MGPRDKKSTALILIRVAAAAMMFVHGAARISNGSVDDFGTFLTGQGFPVGFYLAWAITIFELVGSVLFAAGVYTWIIGLLFALHLGVGVALVHWKQGWFVVGPGTNGMEYSVMLILVFLAIAYAEYKPPARSFRSHR